MSEDLSSSISQKALLLSTQTWESSAVHHPSLRHPSLRSLFTFRSERLRGGCIGITGSAGRKCSVSKTRPSFVAFPQSSRSRSFVLALPQWATIASSDGRLSLCGSASRQGHGAPPRHLAHVHVRVRAWTWSGKRQCVLIKDGLIAKWPQNFGSACTSCEGSKTISPLHLLFFWRLRSQAAKESFRPVFVRIPNQSVRPSPWRDDGHLKDRLCLHSNNRREWCRDGS